MKLHLSKVTLRRPEARDLPQLLEYRNDWEVVQQLEGFSNGYSMRDLELWLEYHRQQQNEVLWAIADKEADRCLGHAGLYQIDHRVRSADFGILIGDKSYWRKGIGRDISRAVISYGFQQLNLHRIEVSIVSTNSTSLSFFESLGFRLEGRRRHAQFRNGAYVDVVVMSLLESEFAGQVSS